MDIRRAIRNALGGGADIDISTEFSELKEALRTLTEASVDTGVADATSLVNRLDDSAKSWPVDAFKDLIVEITAGTGEGQIRKIASNTATSLVPVTNFATAPDATSRYRIGFYGKMTGDISDRAARLLGIVYGNVDQLQQTVAKNLKASIEEHLAATVVLHASGPETTSGNGADTDVGKYLYAETCINVTAFADMASADLIVEGKDETSGKYKTIHTHNFTATGTDWLSITMLAFQHVRARWVINTPGGSPSITFSVALQGKS